MHGFGLLLVAGALALAHEPPTCPQGAEYLVTITSLNGACAVAFDGPSLLVCAPEQVVDGAQSQVMRAAVGDLDPTLWPSASDAVEGAEVRPPAVEPERSAVDLTVDFAADIAVANDGTIAVADASGVVRLLMRDGSQQTVGAGILQSPSGVCWLNDGVLAVSDRRLSAIVLLARDGTERARLGESQVGDPSGLAVSTDGSLYVTDRLRDCLWLYASQPDGTLLQVGRALCERGANPGQLRAPSDVAFLKRGTTGCLFVADELNHRIQILDLEGRFVGFFGMHALIPRQGEGRIHYPRSMAINADGTLIAVAEAFEDRVQLFALREPPNEVDPTAGMSEFITSHFGSEVGCAGDLLALLDRETQGVALLDARTTPPIHMAIIGGSGALPQRFGEVSAIAVEPLSARVWVADALRARIDVFDTVWDRRKQPVVDMFIPQLARSMDLGACSRQWDAVAKGVLRRVPKIVDIAFDPRHSSRVVLLDAANAALIFTGPRLRSALAEPLPDAARAPEELAIAADGRMAVVDPVARALFLRGADGGWTTQTALGDFTLARPTGVHFLGGDAMVVSDAARDACVFLDRNGRARLLGERGILDEQFFDPEAIAASDLGFIVVDRGNHRFQRFGVDGQWNLTGSMGRYYDRKRRGSPGAAPASTPESRGTRGGAS